MKQEVQHGIYVYFVDINKSLRYYHFLNWSNFFKLFDYFAITNNFSTWDNMYNTKKSINNFQSIDYYCYDTTRYFYYSAYNQDGVLFTKDLLIERYKVNERLKKKKRRAKKHKHRGRVYGHYYAIRTVRTRRQDFNDEEISIKIRRKAVPPSSWDREKRTHVEKSWKYQSKRNHQWKNNSLQTRNDVVE